MEKKELTYIVGCDESNHGKYPEIFVAISSIHPDDLLFYQEEIGKKRFKCTSEEQAEKRIKDILECRKYRFLTLHEYHVESLGLNSPKSPAFGQVIASLEHQSHTKVLIDGHGNLNNKKDIEYIISKKTKAKHSIRFCSHGDQHFPILNIADSIAYILFKIYQRISDDEEGPFDKYKVSLEIQKPRKTNQKPRYIRQNHK